MNNCNLFKTCIYVIYFFWLVMENMLKVRKTKTIIDIYI